MVSDVVTAIILTLQHITGNHQLHHYCMFCLCTDQFETSTPPPPTFHPRAYPRHLTVHCAREGGNLNVALERWGI